MKSNAEKVFICNFGKDNYGFISPTEELDVESILEPVIRIMPDHSVYMLTDKGNIYKMTGNNNYMTVDLSFVEDLKKHINNNVASSVKKEIEKIKNLYNIELNSTQNGERKVMKKREVDFKEFLFSPEIKAVVGTIGGVVGKKKITYLVTDTNEVYVNEHNRHYNVAFKETNKDTVKEILTYYYDWLEKRKLESELSQGAMIR